MRFVLEISVIKIFIFFFQILVYDRITFCKNIISSFKNGNCSSFYLLSETTVAELIMLIMMVPNQIIYVKILKKYKEKRLSVSPFSQLSFQNSIIILYYHENLHVLFIIELFVIRQSTGNLK